MDFLKKMKDRARQNPKTIVLPETSDMRTLQACDIILKEKFANIILLGDKDEILKKAEGLQISDATFINPKKYEKFDELVENLLEIRKSKGLTKQQAVDLLSNDYLYFGVMLVNNKIADGMVAGAINSTANVLRPSLQILKTKENVKLVSSFLILDVPDCDFGDKGVFLFTDCGLNQNPNSDELADIAIASANSYENLVGSIPKVAMLSHSTKSSASHEHVDKVVLATKIAQDNAQNVFIDGELQLDAAIVPEVAKLKAPNSNVAGQANVLVFPDLDAANIGYKLVERLAKAKAYGPILQGIKKPVNDLSRGCNKDDIVGVVAITVVQAQQN